MDSTIVKPNEKKLALSPRIDDRIDFYRKKFTRNYKDYGFWISLKKTVAYLVQPFYQKIIYYLYELDLNKYVGLTQGNSNYIFRLIRPEETRLIDQIEEMEEWLKGSFRQKLRDNCLCMVVLDGDRLAGFNYVAVGQAYIPLLKLQVITGPTEAWSEQITVSSDYRRQGLGGQLRSHFYHALKSNGITALYGHRQEFNTASRESAKNFTAGIMVRAEYRRILGMHRLRCFRTVSDHATADDSFTIRQRRIDRPAIKNGSSASPRGARFTAHIEELK